MGTTYAETLASAQLISQGLRANLDTVTTRGLTPAFITAMEANLKKLGDLNGEQEALKAQLKEKTSAVESTLAELKAQISEAKKVVKLALGSDRWKQFGIT